MAMQTMNETRVRAPLAAPLAAALAAALTVALAAAPAAGQTRWWNNQWSHRRAVTVSDVPKTGLPGEEIGVVTMPTAGLIRPDGNDLRVATPAGEAVAHRVLMVGPGDWVRLAFALRPGQKNYFVYLGNPKAPKVAEELTVRRGVLLESWLYRGGSILDLRRVQAAFKRAGQRLGSDFVSEVFLGHNPFGPQNRLCNLFTAQLVCPADGEYVFSTTSRDASFLLIDGKEVVSNGGFHKPQRRAAKQGKITLSKGLHELKFYHVNSRGDPVAVAAWRAPGDRRLWKIPAGAFAPIRRAQPGMLARRGAGPTNVDFIPVHAGESFMANRYYQRYVFDAMISGVGAGGAKYHWDFGDSLSAAGRRCEHVYLRDGEFKVTLTVTMGPRKLTRTNTIQVTRPWARVTESRLDPVGEHARIVSRYDFVAADPRDLAAAVAILKRARQDDAILRAGDALVKRDSAPADVLAEAVPVYAEVLARKDPPRAVAALLKAVEMTNAAPARALLTAKAGRVALAAGDVERAEAAFQQTVKKYAALPASDALRDARIGIGDVARLRGRYDDALAAYQAVRPVKASSFEKQAVAKGDLARHAEAYIRQRMYHDATDFLDRWEWEFPVDKLEGFSTLLRVRLAMAQKKHDQAADLAEKLVRVNPQSNYAAELLRTIYDARKAAEQIVLKRQREYLAGEKVARSRKQMTQAKAEAARAARQGKKAQAHAQGAREALRRLVEGYPESPLAAEAKRLLQRK